MVLLQGSNYDYSAQENTKLTASVSAAGTTLTVENSEGFAVSDYLVIEPGKEKSEIVLISAIGSQTSITVSALTLAHGNLAKIFRMPYNQMKFYESATVDGTYVFITGATVDMTYATGTTNYDDVTGDDDYYFKRTFYNEGTAVESDIGLSTYWQSSDEKFAITSDELRMFLQFDQNDYPTPKDMNFFIGLSEDKYTLDSSSTSVPVKRLAMFMLAKWFVLRGLATRSMSKGYVTVNAEGRIITKATQELILEAENVYQEYDRFLQNQDRVEVIYTQYMNDAAFVSPVTEKQIIDILNGTQNAMDFDGGYGRRRRESSYF